MIFRIIILALVLSFVSCKSYNYSISDLEKEIINFSELPLEVKGFIYNPENHIKNSSEDLDIGRINLSCLDNGSYEYETVMTKIGPWVDYTKIIDEKKNISYRIDQGTPHPYIIFKNRLYISEDFNTLTLKSKIGKSRFTCYHLM